MPTQYDFKTHWIIKAPIQEVWDAIYSSLEWPQWWKGVTCVKELHPGDTEGIGSVREYTWKSVLPYKLSFQMRVTEIERYKRLKGIASGELAGEGEWFFEEREGFTHVQYNWSVVTTKAWMNYFSFLLKPAFQYNHNIIMKWGEEGLKKKLCLLRAPLHSLR